VTVMTQKEVARRFTAPPNSEEYGAITAVCSYYAKATRLFDVSRGNFVPAPNVTSSVVTFLLYKERPVSPKDEKMFFDVIKGSFANRRKTIYNSLSSFFVNTFSKEEIEKALTLSGIPLNTRGEALSIKEFSALSDALYEIKNN